MKKHSFSFILFAVLLLPLISCKKKTEENQEASIVAPTPTPAAPRYLYVASGACYPGNGLTAETPSRTVVKVDTSSSQTLDILMDYNVVTPGDSPIAVLPYGTNSLLSVVENASGRRVDIISRTSANTFSTWVVNSTALSGVLRGAILMADGGLLLSKTTAIEKFTSSKARVLSGANPYINAPAGTCATSTTNITAMVQTSSGKIIMAHAAASPNNKISFISSGGYNVAGDCLGAYTTPTVSGNVLYPVAMSYVASNNQVLVAYSSSVSTEMIYAYDVDETNNTLINPVVAYANSGQSVLNGISAMTYDDVAKMVYVANGSTAFTNSIEKFSYDPASKAMNRQGTVSFYGPNVFSKCVSGMLVSE